MIDGYDIGATVTASRRYQGYWWRALWSRPEWLRCGECSALPLVSVISMSVGRPSVMPDDATTFTGHHDIASRSQALNGWSEYCYRHTADVSGAAHRHASYAHTSATPRLHIAVMSKTSAKSHQGEEY